MNDLDYEFILQDRIAKIQAINKQYDLEHNAYISFSGGKDSTVLHYLIDLALPNNNIPRMYINTGVEYSDVRKFVKNLSFKDGRIQIVNSNVNIKNMLNNDGYPFKSKQHSHNWLVYKNNEVGFKYFIEMIENCPRLLQNTDFISALPKGIKTNIKYIYGIREKETQMGVDERESSIYIFQGLP